LILMCVLMSTVWYLMLVNPRLLMRVCVRSTSGVGLSVSRDIIPRSRKVLSVVDEWLHSSGDIAPPWDVASAWNYDILIGMKATVH
jgi:hypothetical protein